MKLNLPVTGQEKRFSADKTLVSKTDTKGIITFANQDFIDISGFSEAELVGANHNLIRHPDMPPAAFEVMWKTIKQGYPWHGTVKNRCKNGDHYWVDAKVVPVKKAGQIIGYMSVRTSPSRDAVAAAEAAYQKAAKAPELIEEEAVPAWQKYLSLKNGIPLWILAVTLMMIAGGILGITGLSLSNNAIQSLYLEDMDPVQAIGRINFLMADNRAQVALALHHNPVSYPDTPHDHPLSAHLETVARNKVEIDKLWSRYSGAITNPEEKALAERYWQARNRYVEDGLLVARQALSAGEFTSAEKILTTKVTPLYDEANAAVSVLLKHLSDRGRDKFTAVTERNLTIINVAIASIALCTLALAIAGYFFFRLTTRPLLTAMTALENIAEGNLSDTPDGRGYGEPGRVMAAVTLMQMHLKVMMHEIRQASDAIYYQTRQLNQTMMNLSEHSEEQHDRVYQATDAIAQSCSGLKAVADQAETLSGLVDGHTGQSSGASSAIGTNPSSLEPMPAELLAMFGEAPAPAPETNGTIMGVSTTPPAGELPASAPTAIDSGVYQRVQELAGAARVHAFAVEDVARQLEQVTDLIVQNREEVQAAWVASKKLENTAHKLDQLVKYFE